VLGSERQGGMGPREVDGVELLLPFQEILDEAKRSGVPSGELDLRMMPSGGVLARPRTLRAWQFVGELRSQLPTDEWPELVRWAAQIDADAARGQPIDGALALKLARALVLLGGDEPTTVTRVRAVQDERPSD
jgi:hypothetical protein